MVNFGFVTDFQSEINHFRLGRALGCPKVPKTVVFSGFSGFDDNGYLGPANKGGLAGLGHY